MYHIDRHQNKITLPFKKKKKKKPIQGVLYLKFIVCTLWGCFGEYSENILCHHIPLTIPSRTPSVESVF